MIYRILPARGLQKTNTCYSPAKVLSVASVHTHDREQLKGTTENPRPKLSYSGLTLRPYLHTGLTGLTYWPYQTIIAPFFELRTKKK